MCVGAGGGCGGTAVVFQCVGGRDKKGWGWKKRVASVWSARGFVLAPRQD